jgi:surface antigen
MFANPKSKTITRALSLAAVLFLSSGTAIADSFDDQIATLRAQAAAQQQQAAAAHAQANDYRSKVAELNAQIGYLQTQINLTQAKFNRVTADINANKAKLEQQKAVLSANLKTMYLDSSVSPIEMLASSNNMSDFLDQQTYQDKIKAKIQSAMAEINAIQEKLQAQQLELTTLLSNQRTQRTQLAGAQAQMYQLLALAEQNAAAADQSVRDSNSQISKLKAEQAAALAAKYGNRVIPGGACGGGYPARWCNAAQDTVIDNWGMFNRECVSYTAFKVWSSGRNMPYWGGTGNANQWPGDARASGIPVDGNPREGDVAISMSGPYGHAMYVEGVSGGTILVSQYNFYGNGQYSTMSISASGLYFIHFR